MPTTTPERRLELSRAVNRLSNAVLRGDTTSDVLQSLVDIAGETLQVDRALIYDVRLETEQAVALCEWRLPGSVTPSAKATYPLRLFATATAEVSRTGAPLESSYLAVNPLLAADGADALIHGELGIQRFLCYPFRQTPNGFLAVVFSQVHDDRPWTDEEREFVETVATQACLAIMKLELLHERERAEAQLRTSERRFRLFYDATPSMFFTVDAAGMVLSVNRFATQHLGYSTPELIGHNVLEIIHPDDRVAVQQHLAACFADAGAVREISFRKRCKDGSIRWVKEATRVADGPDGPTALIICDDITEARAHEEAARKAESKSHDRDEFMAMLGHELRNPLTPIVTALQILRRIGRNDDELAMIERQVAHLRRLVDDLLDVSRITRGRVELAMEDVELADVAAQAEELARPLFQQKRQRLIVDMARGLLVHADPSRLVQAFANLLTNASKFSADGETVLFSAERRGDRIVVRVVDHGEGIEPEMLDRVFELFAQRSQPADRAQSGLGLGLTIVRNLIAMHGGTVRARSDGRGSGTTIEVDLPALECATITTTDERRGVAPPTVRDAALGGVLVVDDSDDVRLSLCRALSLYGYQTFGAGDGPSALLAVAEHRPRVVLIDIGLPGMDGYELARRLRGDDSTGHAARLVAVTGYGQPSDRTRAREAGFTAHFVKPVDIETLLTCLEADD